MHQTLQNSASAFWNLNESSNVVICKYHVLRKKRVPTRHTLFESINLIWTGGHEQGDHSKKKNHMLCHNDNVDEQLYTRECNTKDAMYF